MINKLKKHLDSLLFIALGVLLAFFPLYFNGGFIGDLGDPIGQTIPNKYLLVEYLKNGILPLWNSFSFLGFPFLADIQVGTFYFPDWIFFSVFEPLIAHNISLLAHIIFAGIGIYFFCFNNLKSKISSVSIALSVVLSGSFLSRIVYLNFLETISFIPWVLLVLDNRNSSFRWLVGLFSLMIFAGHPVAMFYSSIIIAVYLLFNHFGKLKKIITAGFLSLLVCSVQIIPFVYLKIKSVRNTLDYSNFVSGSLEFIELNSFLFLSKLPITFDKFIYFGTFAFLYVLISPLLFKDYKRSERKLLLTGLFLFVLGIILSLGSNFEILSKILFEIPIFNLIRVPARYILISHFGVLLMLIGFFGYFNKKRKLLLVLLGFPLILNSILTPYFTLERHEIINAEQEYNLAIQKTIENESLLENSINSVPEYFLSSSFFLFPNRHILSHLHNVIGYNPLILERFYNFIPVSPVGSFENPNYLIDYYQKFNLIGLKYYIFPSNQFLKLKNLEEKTYVNNFLEKNNWERISSEDFNFKIWRNQNSKPFIYFEKPENKVLDIDFTPGKILLEVNTNSDDNLIINQTFIDGWFARTDLSNESIKASNFNDIVQKYSVKKSTRMIEIIYFPKEFIWGLVISIFGIFGVFLLCRIENKPDCLK